MEEKVQRAYLMKNSIYYLRVYDILEKPWWASLDDTS